LAFLGSTVLPPLITQSIHLGDKLPEYLSTVLPMVKIDVQMITSQVGPLGENILKVTLGLFSNIITIFTIFVISFYFLLERQYLEEHLSSFFGKDQATITIKIMEKVEEKLGAWVRGQLLLGLTIWLFTFIGLLLLGIPYVLSLSIFAGIMEIVPIIGPIISAIPALLVALTYSPVLALGTLALFFAIQQVEAHLIVPMVMKRAVGLPPVISIIALMVGAKLGGIMGALLSVPVILTLTTTLTEYLHHKEKK
jgi:predicted PurR-regulated permease PerM